MLCRHDMCALMIQFNLSALFGQAVVELMVILCCPHHYIDSKLSSAPGQFRQECATHARNFHAGPWLNFDGTFWFNLGNFCWETSTNFGR